MIEKMHKLLEKFKKDGELCLPCVVGAAIVVLVALFAITMIVGSGPAPEEAPEDLTQEDVDAIVQHGQILLTERLNAGDDLSSGPCLDNAETYENWVIDIAHDPREAVDDEPENQCAAYRSGRAEHFVELSTSGDIIRISPDVRGTTTGSNE